MCVEINKQIRNRLGFQTVAAISNSISFIYSKTTEQIKYFCFKHMCCVQFRFLNQTTLLTDLVIGKYTFIKQIQK